MEVKNEEPTNHCNELLARGRQDAAQKKSSAGASLSQRLMPNAYRLTFNDRSNEVGELRFLVRLLEWERLAAIESTGPQCVTRRESIGGN